MTCAAIWIVFAHPMFVAPAVGGGGDIRPIRDTIIRTDSLKGQKKEDMHVRSIIK
jgi:hypothetical protein